MNIGNLLKKAATKAKENPELTLIVVGLVAPKVVPKIAKVAAAVKVAKALD